MRIPRVIVISVFGVLLAISAVLIFWAERRLSGLVVGGLGEAFSTKIYSAPLVLSAGNRKSVQQVIARLKRLQYRESPDLSAPGQYSWKGSSLRIYLRAFEVPGLAQPPQIAHLAFDSSGISEIRQESGEALSRA